MTIDKLNFTEQKLDDCGDYLKRMLRELYSTQVDVESFMDNLKELAWMLGVKIPQPQKKNEGELFQLAHSLAVLRSKDL